MAFLHEGAITQENEFTEIPIICSQCQAAMYIQSI